MVICDELVLIYTSLIESDFLVNFLIPNNFSYFKTGKYASLQMALIKLNLQFVTLA